MGEEETNETLIENYQFAILGARRKIWIRKKWLLVKNECIYPVPTLSSLQHEVEQRANSTTFWNTIYFYTASATAGNLSYDCARGRHRAVSAAASRRHVDASLDFFA